jgi:predicted RNA-binding Zn ribbon-like protein
MTRQESDALRDPAARAPGTLELVRRFLNTENAEAGLETLAAPDEGEVWLRSIGLWTDERAPTTRELERLRRLRTALRGLAAANRSGTGHDEAARALRAAAATPRVAPTIGADGMLTLESHRGGVAGVVDRLFGALYEAQARSDLGRLKACRECGWAFFDRSRNRSGTWCSMDVCGSRVKMRRYRAAGR